VRPRASWITDLLTPDLELLKFGFSPNPISSGQAAFDIEIRHRARPLTKSRRSLKTARRALSSTVAKRPQRVFNEASLGQESQTAGRDCLVPLIEGEYRIARSFETTRRTLLEPARNSSGSQPMRR
jgi:hypothetical protein